MILRIFILFIINDYCLNMFSWKCNIKKFFNLDKNLTSNVHNKKFPLRFSFAECGLKKEKNKMFWLIFKIKFFLYGIN